MPNFRLYISAQNALEDIWLYSFQTWNEGQANRYIQQIYGCFQKLASKEYPWRKLPTTLSVPADVKHSLYFHHHARHYIFFRELTRACPQLTFCSIFERF